MSEINSKIFIRLPPWRPSIEGEATLITDADNVRERLANRRPTETLQFNHGGFRYIASIGRFHGGNRDGELAEVFISGPKTGTDVQIASRDASIVASIALQFGASAEVLRRAIGRNSDGSAAGPLGKLLDILAKESAR
jgi:hypothetical protein